MRAPVNLCVLDASAVIAYLRSERGQDIVEGRLLARGCLIHAINICEVLYFLRRLMTREEAEQDIRDFLAQGVVAREDFDLSFLQIVADYKIAPTSTPMGDCFGLALVQRENLPSVASDRGDMERVATRGTVVIDFIR